MAAELIPLDEWAKRKYGDAAPGIGTLRRWAREQRIFPCPKKHGRTYFVQPDAEYWGDDATTPPQRLAEKLARPSARA